MKDLTRKNLWESGVQFGHVKNESNPKMKPYIYGIKKKIHIIDIEKTAQKLEEAKQFIVSLAEKKAKILFVGTKKQAKWAIENAATRSGQYYVVERWLGGTLTNLDTIKKRISRLYEIIREEKLGKISQYPKKEQLKIQKEKAKLERLFGGITKMRLLPNALFVVDAQKDITAIKEAHKLNIPVIGICDSNCDPDLFDYPIPCNDDYYKAIELIVHYLVDCYGEACGEEYPEPEAKPQELILKDTNKKTYFKKPNYQANNNNSSNNYVPVIPLNVNKQEFLKAKVFLNLNNYKKIIKEGLNTETALKAASLVKTKKKIIKYEDVMLKTLLAKENKLKEKNKLIADNETILKNNDSIKQDVQDNQDNFNYFENIQLLNNNIIDSLSSLKVANLKLIAKNLNLDSKLKKKELIDNIAQVLDIKDGKIIKK